MEIKHKLQHRIKHFFFFYLTKTLLLRSVAFIFDKTIKQNKSIKSLHILTTGSTLS